MSTPVLALLLLATAVLAPRATPADQDRPNILVLLTDDQRTDTIAAHGNPHIDTPHLDRLAQEGFSFRRAYGMGSIHGAVCQPSRAMMLSGRSLYRVDMALADVVTLPELLGADGYATFATGKWHNGRESFARSFQQGCSVFFGGMSDHECVPLVDLQGDSGFSEERVEGYSTELFVDAAIAFLRAHDGTRPFFAWIAFTAPHDPRQPPQRWREHYAERHVPLPPNFLPQHSFNNGWLVGRDETLAPWPRPPETIREQIREYYGMVSHVDEQVGRLLAALAETGHADDTLVVLTSDHGLALGSHGLLGKQSLYEHSTGTPLIVAGPGVPAGESDALVYLFDLFPTLAEVAGAPLPEDVEGVDLAPIWRGEQSAAREVLFTTYEDSQRALTDGRWKLIRYPRIGRTQLFDLANDPHELVDLAAEPAQAERVASMLDRLAAAQRAFADEIPLTAEELEPAEIDLSGRAREPDRHQPAWIVDKYFGEG